MDQGGGRDSARGGVRSSPHLPRPGGRCQGDQRVREDPERRMHSAGERSPLAKKNMLPCGRSSNT
eukprot:scaffold1395_cov244-Pinguiococcus_pyrenoidosus.AAC.4